MGNNTSLILLSPFFPFCGAITRQASKGEGGLESSGELSIKGNKESIEVETYFKEAKLQTEWV